MHIYVCIYIFIMTGRILTWPPIFPGIHALHNFFPLSAGKPENTMGYHFHNYVTLYSKRDFAVIIKVSISQL